LRYGSAASSSRVTGKPEVILEWCQQGNALIELVRSIFGFNKLPNNGYPESDAVNWPATGF
jgi:hypothetical protein